ncbi:Flp pilus assembly protein CpaB [Stenotrophomonas rhizophila]|uniref:Flp pilus assembly protein CpaB n=1 Tax=Stenotrophomonas rhizophila TaxID=216778 RepID=UPI0028D8F4B2|nr:Flp pilus assembly protein CpaB [Stenotrophomonas rhizophila]
MLKLTRIAAVALIALALLLAVVAFLVSRRAAPTVVAAPQVTGQPQQWPVVEAAGELPAGRPINAADLRIGSAPQAPQGGYASIAEATGAVPVHTIAAGTPLNSALMARGYALRLNPGERALAVPVDELVAAGNRILPGDYVDVFLNLRAPQGMGTEGQAQARLLLSRMRVLSYGAADTVPGQAAPTDTAGEASTDARAQDIQGSASPTSSTSTSAPVRSAVLAVPVAEANRLLLGAQQGRLFLALRNPADVGQPDQELFAQPGGVLDARRELSPEQRLALQSPENGAYAGIDSDALAGRSTRSPARSPAPVRASAPRQAPRLDRGVEIIRGDVSSHSGSR